jgi:hypothetical protein
MMNWSDYDAVRQGKKKSDGKQASWGFEEKEPRW